MLHFLFGACPEIQTLSLNSTEGVMITSSPVSVCFTFENLMKVWSAIPKNIAFFCVALGENLTTVQKQAILVNIIRNMPYLTELTLSFQTFSEGESVITDKEVEALLLEIEDVVHLKRLDLSFNDISDESVDIIRDLLNANTSLTFVLRECQISRSLQEDLKTEFDERIILDKDIQPRPIDRIVLD